MLPKTIGYRRLLPLILVITGCAASIPASTPLPSSRGGAVAVERAAEIAGKVQQVNLADNAVAGHPAAAMHDRMTHRMGATEVAGDPERCPLRKAQALTAKPPLRCPLAGTALSR